MRNALSAVIEWSRIVLERFENLRAARPLVVWVLVFSLALIVGQVVFAAGWGRSVGEGALAATVAAIGSLVWVTRQDDELNSDPALPELGPEENVDT